MTIPNMNDPLASKDDPGLQIPNECKALIPSDAQDLLCNIHNRLNMLQRWADQVIIQDEETHKNAASKLAFLSNAGKQLDTKRKELTKPIDQHKSLIMLPFKQLQDRVNVIGGTLGNKVTRWQDEVEAREKARIEDERRKQLEALEAQKKEQEQQAEINDSDLARQDAEDTAQMIKDVKEAPVTTAPVRAHTLAGTVGRAKRWTYEVVDLKKVPRKYLATVVKVPKAGQQVGHLDSGHQLVMADINKGVREIAGIRIYQKSHIGVR